MLAVHYHHAKCSDKHCRLITKPSSGTRTRLRSSVSMPSVLTRTVVKSQNVLQIYKRARGPLTPCKCSDKHCRRVTKRSSGARTCLRSSVTTPSAVTRTVARSPGCSSLTRTRRHRTPPESGREMQLTNACIGLSAAIGVQNTKSATALN